MQRSLEQAGIRYLFLGAELGGRPANPDYYDAKGHVLYSRLRDDAPSWRPFSGLSPAWNVSA